MQDKTQRILEEMLQLPPDMTGLRALLEGEKPTSEQLAMTANQFMEIGCWREVDEFVYAHGRQPEPAELHSTYIFSLMQLLLEYGMNPNLVIDGDNVMEWMGFVDFPYVSADTMRLFMEHGGDVDLIIDGDTMFMGIYYDIVFGAFEQEDRQFYDCLVHLWLVLIGYGGRIPGNECPLNMKDGKAPEIFRQHERFDWEIERTSAVEAGWIMHILDRETGEEVAEL